MVKKLSQFSIIIRTKKNIKEDELLVIINKELTLLKYLNKKIIKRKVYIKDKLINIII